MKKLIDELEAGKKFTDEIFNDTPVGKALKEGFEAAYRIARAHNPWHEVANDGLPEPDKLLWFLCGDGSVYLGYYASFIEDGITNYLWSVIDTRAMIYILNNEIVAETMFDDDYDVTNYRYIPTDLPEVKP